MKTLEHLLLETLSTDVMSVNDLSALWGEDRVRVQEWVKKFVRKGLVFQTPNGEYEGWPVKIAEYLRTT